MSNRKPLAIILALVLFGMIAPLIHAPYVPGTGSPNYSISFSATKPDITSFTLGASPVNTQFWAYVWLNNATGQTIDTNQAPDVGVGGISVHVDFSGILTYCAPIGFLNYVTGNVGIGSLIGVFNSSTPGELLVGVAAGFYNSDGPVAGPPYIQAPWYEYEASTTHATAWYTTYVPPGEPQTTAGLVAGIEFNVTGQPTIAQPPFVGQIGFTSDLLTGLVDFSAALPINFDEFPGTLTIPAATAASWNNYPTTEPEIYLTTYPISAYVPGNPAPTFDISGQPLGYQFNVTVAIANNKGTITGVDPIWDVAGFDVSLTWNNTLINFVQGFEGGMLKSGGCLTQGLNGGSFNNGFAIYPPVGDQDTAEAVFTKTTDPTPSQGIDSLAIFEFQVALLPPLDTIVDSPIAMVHNSTNGFYQPDLATWAHPEINNAPWNSSITAMDMGPPNSGPITWTANGGSPIPAGFFGVGPDADLHYYLASYITIIPGWHIDLYDQYPDPYGGQGLGQHSDSFSPQQNVTLYAKVTFNGAPVVNKLVIFQINDATGKKFTLLQNYTDHNGIARVWYRIPQEINVSYLSCGMDPQVFGWWEAVANVEIDQQIASDYMWYQVGWLIQVLRVDIGNYDQLSTTGPTYGGVFHNETVKFTVTPTSTTNEPLMHFNMLVLTIHEQPLTVTLSVDTYDVEGYPLTENLFVETISATRTATNTTGGVFEYGEYQFYFGSLSGYPGILPTYFHEDPAGAVPVWTSVPLYAYLPYWARVSPGLVLPGPVDAGHASVIGYALTALPAAGGVPYGPQSNANDAYTPSNPLVEGFGTGTPFFIMPPL